MNINPFAIITIITKEPDETKQALMHAQQDHILEHTLTPQIPDPRNVVNYIAYSIEYVAYQNNDFIQQITDLVKSIDPSATIEINCTSRNYSEIKYDTGDKVWGYSFKTSKNATKATRCMTPTIGILAHNIHNVEDNITDTPYYFVPLDKNHKPLYSKAERIENIHITPFWSEANAGYNFLVRQAIDQNLQRAKDFEKYFLD